MDDISNRDARMPVHITAKKVVLEFCFIIICVSAAILLDRGYLDKYFLPSQINAMGFIVIGLMFIGGGNTFAVIHNYTLPQWLSFLIIHPLVVRGIGGIAFAVGILMYLLK